LRKNLQTDLHEIFGEGWQCANAQMIKFWWRSGSLSGCRDCFWIRHCWEIQKVVNRQICCSYWFARWCHW